MACPELRRNVEAWARRPGIMSSTLRISGIVPRRSLAWTELGSSDCPGMACDSVRLGLLIPQQAKFLDARLAVFRRRHRHWPAMRRVFPARQERFAIQRLVDADCRVIPQETTFKSGAQYRSFCRGIQRCRW